MEQRWLRDRRGNALALVIPHTFDRPGYNFVTPPELPLQLGLNAYAAGRVVPPHRHKRWQRSIEDTLELVLVRSGRVRMIVFDEEGERADSVELGAGDIILFVDGGHSWEFLEDSQIMEVKQGPYTSVEQDKTLLASAKDGAR